MAELGSGNYEFDQLRLCLMHDKSVQREVEFAFAALLTAANPSDRGMRFLFGGGAEWIMAAASWAAGVLTAPAGHNADGFDLGDLLTKARGLWSVKASASKASAQIRLTNFMGDGLNAVWEFPTMFVAPYFGGAVLVDPRVHLEVRDQMKRASDALVISGKVVKDFRDAHPANFIPFEVAINNRNGSGDPFSFIKSVLSPDHFPILAKPFLASTPVSARNRVEEIQKLVDLRDQGVLTEEHFRKVIDQVIS